MGKSHVPFALPWDELSFEGGVLPPHPDSRGLLCCNGPFCLETTFLRGDPPVGCAPLEGLGGEGDGNSSKFLLQGATSHAGPRAADSARYIFLGSSFSH